MNWYKKCLASSNIPIPDKIKSEIMNICSDIIQNWLDFEKSGKIEKKVARINIPDPYYGINRGIDIFVAKNSKTNSTMSIIAGYNPDDMTISIFPENMVRSNIVHSLSDKNSSSKLYYFVMHEIEHAIDPFLNRKIEEKNKDRSPEKDNKFYEDYWKDYKTGYVEFNAYSRQITEAILSGCQNNIFEVAQWLRGKNILPVPKCIDGFYGIIMLWWESKPVLIRKLKQRIYNEIKNKLPKKELEK